MAHSSSKSAFAIGDSGRRVADLLHARTGWFPQIETLSLSRRERPGGGYDHRELVIAERQDAPVEDLPAPVGALLVEAVAVDQLVQHQMVLGTTTLRVVLVCIPRARRHAERGGTRKS